MSGLTEEQRAVVECADSRIVVHACPGSGKTRTLIATAAKWLKDGADPASMSLLTYTRRAAAEMKQRLAKLVGPDGERVHVETIHGAWFGLLCRHAERLGYTSKMLTLVGYDDRKNLLAHAATGIKAAPREINDALMMYSAGENPPSYQTEAVINAYRTLLCQENAVDYLTMCWDVSDLLEKSPDALADARARTRFLLVDEFQDADLGQFRYFKGMEPQRLLCVGDPDQAIYGWRGANPGLSDELKATRLRLTQNFRSHIGIINAANGFRYKSRICAVDAPSMRGLRAGLPPEIKSEDQAAAACGETPFVVLARTNRIVEGWASFLNQHAIRHKIAGRSLKLIEQPAIRTALAYFAWPSLPSSGLLCERVCRNEALMGKSGVGGVTVQLKSARIRADAREGAKTLFETAPEHIPSLGEFYATRGTGGDELARCVERAERGQERDQEAFEALFELYVQHVSESAGRPQNPGRFINWLTSLDGTASSDLDCSVVIMTIHAAKGLEFDNVMIVGLRDDELPWNGDRSDNLAEEARLFYVAMTRAKDRLVFVRPTVGTPSRFLEACQ